MGQRRTAALVIVGVIAVIAFGSFLYWRGEGSPGTPAQFRERIAATGLVVEWEQNGPRAGDGVVDTDCGRIGVTIDAIDDELWLTTSGVRRLITPDSIDQLIACDTG